MLRKLEEYINKKGKLMESAKLFKDNCYLLSENKEMERSSEKRNERCIRAKLELRKIQTITRDMAIDYSDRNNYKLREKINQKFGNYFQPAISIFPNNNKGADCYGGNCGETPGAIINLWCSLKKTENGSKITSLNKEKQFKADNIEKWIL